MRWHWHRWSKWVVYTTGPYTYGYETRQYRICSVCDKMQDETVAIAQNPAVTP